MNSKFCEKFNRVWVLIILIFNTRQREMLYLYVNICLAVRSTGCWFDTAYFYIKFCIFSLCVFECTPTIPLSTVKTHAEYVRPTSTYITQQFHRRSRWCGLAHVLALNTKSEQNNDRTTTKMAEQLTGILLPLVCCLYLDVSKVKSWSLVPG